MDYPSAYPSIWINWEEKKIISTIKSYNFSIIFTHQTIHSDKPQEESFSDVDPA